MAYNHGKAERKWKLWKEKEEKILRDSGVSEDIIETIRLYDRQAFNSDRRYSMCMSSIRSAVSIGKSAPRVSKS